MSPCPSCGHANADGAKFCSDCGAAFGAVRRVAHEERKVVTVLFADLVGFTSRSERLDPEDVRALLSPYYARLRAELERFGGTVEKFIGDAVMALFGAPVAHEDDPERAVRAALAIRDWVRSEERIQVRIAVNTGEALVSLDARPAEGEGMAAGDVINTTARLQTAAPVNGVLVGERTYRATSRIIDYALAEPVAAKGKEQPVPAWVAVEPRARFGIDVPEVARTVLVGRERELSVLREALTRVREERAAQLVTLIGVPGIGKSRLLYELSLLVDADAELISWRQGRSLPYGEAVSFWALAEMVKAQAGILDSDSTDVADEKLRHAVDQTVPDAVEAEWVRRHLRQLVGVRGEAVSPPDARGETFAAWRRFIEALAEQRPLVLVFEDLHWADDGLLDFVDHLVDWVTDVPLLVVCSARPELLARRSDWGGGKPNSSTLSLSPLSDEDTARLIGTMLERPLLRAEQQQELLLRAAGNPLFAEQYAQMLSEHDVGPDLPVPETVQDLVGARLDSLPIADKRLLQAAAVIGKVFWRSSVAALADDDVNRAQLDQRLHDLVRRQFIRRERASSLAGDDQYAFLHVVLRDAAYGQMPRAARADQHVAAAKWIESLGRSDDFADMLAHHYQTALELMRTTGQDTTILAEPARAALRAAGERAMALSAWEQAASHFQAALELCPESAPDEQARLMLQLATARTGFAPSPQTEELQRARDALLAAGLTAEAAEAEARLARIWWVHGQRDRSSEHLARAEELIRNQPSTAHTAFVLSELARFRMLAGSNDLAVANKGLRMAEELGMDMLRAHLLITIGSVYGRFGRPEGMKTVRQGLDIAIAGSYVDTALRGYSNLAAIIEATTGDVLETFQLAREAFDLANRRASHGHVRWAMGNVAAGLFDLGEWDECARICDEFLAESASSGGHYHDSLIHMTRAWMRLARGDVTDARTDVEEAITKARGAKDPQVVLSVFALASHVLAMAGDTAAANTAFGEAVASGHEAHDYLGSATIDLILAARMLGRRDEVAAWLGESDSAWRKVSLALLSDNIDVGLPMLDGLHARRASAVVRLSLAKAGAATGTPPDWRDHLGQALAFFRQVNALRLVREAEALLPASA